VKRTKGSEHWQRTENFGKFMHLLWDLGLIQRFLPERQDILVLLCMLRYADFRTGECTLFIGKICAETGVAHPTQIGRIQAKIVAMGAFWRPEGKKGFKMVNGKWITRYYRSTGKQIIDHAFSEGLISEDKFRELELRHVEDQMAREAEEALTAEVGGRDTAGLDNFPETIDELSGTVR
jgi:hypothetical protein